MYSRILVPLDGTAESNAALPAARTMAKATGASVFLLRVVESSDANTSPDDATDKLKRVAAELAGNGVQVESAVRTGQAADEIVQQVGEQGADLVIMRTRGQSGIQRAVMGSVGERLLTRTDVPIIMLRPGGRRMDQIASLMVPVDGSPGGGLALSAAVELAKSTRAQVRLIEVVVPMVFHTLTADVGTTYYDPAWDDEALAAAETYVAGMVARLQAAEIRADGEARMAGDIPGRIVQAADEHTSDMVVMSTHALTGIQRAVLGSVADAVVRSAACPVLLLRRKSQDN